MKNYEHTYPDEQQIEAALKEELERVKFRSDLWSLVQAGVRRQQRKHRRRWRILFGFAGHGRFADAGLRHDGDDRDE